jgi:hypothetical protein
MQNDVQCFFYSCNLNSYTCYKLCGIYGIEVVLTTTTNLVSVELHGIVIDRVMEFKTHIVPTASLLRMPVQVAALPRISIAIPIRILIHGSTCFASMEGSIGCLVSTN